MMKRIRKLFRYIRVASPSRSVFGQMYDLFLHKVLINLGPNDYYFLGLYKRQLTWKQRARFTSAQGARYWIYEKNPFKYQVLFTDKYIQKLVLAGLNLPTPELFAMIGAGGTVATLSDFRSSVDSAPDEFVLKPVSARGGRGFRKITKRDGELLDAGQPIQLEELWESLQRDLERGVLMEEAAHNHPIVGRMNPSSLNTFRVITFHLPDKGWVPICSYLKVGRANSLVDNSGAGGLLVRIDENGKTGSAVDFKTQSEHSHHPDSGAALEGEVIEGVADVVQLAVNASAPFSQMGILGWDIALTPDGPRIIEVNASPSCDYPQVAYGGLVTDEMAEVLKPRHMFSRYPLTHMYPNHLRNRKGRI